MGGVNKWFVSNFIFKRVVRALLFAHNDNGYNSSYLVNWTIGLMNRVFANGPGNRGSIPGRVIRKTQKMVLYAALLSTKRYKVRIKGKEE